MSKQAKTAAFVLSLWAATIFVTSCFFIDRDRFIRFIARFLPIGATQHAWSVLWLYAGIFIVKGYHVTEYAVLYTLVTLVGRSLRPGSLFRHPVFRFGVCLLFAASDEWHQTFVPGRGGTAIDVGIDTLGISIAATILHLRHRTKERKTKQQ